eukprot:CAMPEP_0174368104 /NCGR_PEP_ID=MMETSP0811_2-20130205/87819_1 /TAXON_ID=73025 ORGANISM="Eutreptiella gymnastica-like, Strain CCMP1594" /NCGR_SAMPLE_ID=MMETSP0811_2 /ASSEMBLY_ACC=CAM_ASM_000667 /LENGTH=120 /DNA_ID=CAMNT_0015511299 /DNA_START=205 /DNA_END=567 /DNA_ORIENTATION=-
MGDRKHNQSSRGSFTLHQQLAKPPHLSPMQSLHGKWGWGAMPGSWASTLKGAAPGLQRSPNGAAQFPSALFSTVAESAPDLPHGGVRNRTKNHPPWKAPATLQAMLNPQSTALSSVLWQT